VEYSRGDYSFIQFRGFNVRADTRMHMDISTKEFEARSLALCADDVLGSLLVSMVMAQNLGACRIHTPSGPHDDFPQVPQSQTYGYRKCFDFFSLRP